MKSLKDYSLKLDEQEYHDYPAWSYSIIAKYAKEGFAAMATLFDKTEPTSSMRFGSLFDSILTKGKSTLDEYAVMDVTVPESERKALDYISTTTDKTFDSLTKEFIYDRCQECGYQSKWGVDAKYNHLAPYKDYFDIKQSGKKLVSKTDWDDAIEMARIFRNDDYLKTIFGTKNTDDIEYIYQSQFLVKWDFGGSPVSIKIMPDLLVVNHRDKTVQPVDLKTSAMPAYSFAENFIKFRYDIQAELYTDVLKKVLEDAEGYEDYTVLPYLFTDISRTDKVPVTYEYDPTNGFAFNKNGKEYQYAGWKQLLAEIMAYRANDAKVPNYIVTDGPNDLISILSK